MSEEVSEITLSQLQSWKQSDGQEVTALFPGCIFTFSLIVVIELLKYF